MTSLLRLQLFYSIMKKTNPLAGILSNRHIPQTFNDMFWQLSPGKQNKIPQPSRKASPQSSRLHQNRFVKLEPIWMRKNRTTLRLVREERIERLNVLRQVKSIINEYEANKGEIVEPMCEKIHSVLKSLSEQESVYGGEMNSFFGILEKMIFCRDQEAIDVLQESNKPFGVLVNKALKQRLQKVRTKQQEVESRVHEINGRIAEIQARNEEKLRVLKLQYENSVSSVSIQYKRQTNQLRSKIEELKQALQSRDAKLCKLQLKVPTQLVNRESKNFDKA